MRQLKGNRSRVSIPLELGTAACQERAHGSDVLLGRNPQQTFIRLAMKRPSSFAFWMPQGNSLGTEGAGTHGVRWSEERDHRNAQRSRKVQGAGVSSDEDAGVARQRY